MAEVVLSKGRVRPIWSGHPWVFAQAVKTVRGAPGAGAQGAVGQNGAPVHIVFHHHHDAAAAGQGGAMTQVGSNQMQQQQAAGAQQQQQQQTAIPDLPKMLNFPGGSVAPPS